MELTVLSAVTALTATVWRQLAVPRLHQSCAAVVAQQEVVAELQAMAVVEPAARCLMYLEPTRLDQ